jgi:hypothetical protein
MRSVSIIVIRHYIHAPNARLYIYPSAMRMLGGTAKRSSCVFALGKLASVTYQNMECSPLHWSVLSDILQSVNFLRNFERVGSAHFLFVTGAEPTKVGGR